MLSFNLSRLNVHSPYVVWQDGQDLLFRTDHGILFAVVFDEEVSADNAYWLNLYNRSGKNSPSDSRLKDTVVCIVEEFFRSNPGILLYMCDTADDRQAMRARLFQRWFHESGAARNYVIRVAMIMDEDMPNYLAMIVQRTNPHLHDILWYFDNEVRLFESNK